MRLIDVSVLKEWIENWFTKNRLYHPYAKNNNIPITELYDILEQMPSAQPEIIYCKDCVHHIDGFFCRQADHYTSDRDYCASVFGAERREK